MSPPDHRLLDGDDSPCSARRETPSTRRSEQIKSRQRLSSPARSAGEAGPAFTRSTRRHLTHASGNRRESAGGFTPFRLAPASAPISIPATQPAHAGARRQRRRTCNSAAATVGQTHRNPVMGSSGWPSSTDAGGHASNLDFFGRHLTGTAMVPEPSGQHQAGYLFSTTRRRFGGSAWPRRVRRPRRRPAAGGDGDDLGPGSAARWKSPITSASGRSSSSTSRSLVDRPELLRPWCGIVTATTGVPWVLRDRDHTFVVRHGRTI